LTEELQSKLNEIIDRFDKRITYCQLDLEHLGDGRWRLSGRVLDKATLQHVVGELEQAYPGCSFETAGVEVLRPGRQMTVNTGISGLHGGPTFSSELVSQLVAGWTVEVLISEDRWAFVRQKDGYLGWTFRHYLAQETPPNPTHLVHAPICPVRPEPAFEASPVDRLLAGTAVRAEESEGLWFRLAGLGGANGWVPADHLRLLSALPETETRRRQQVAQDALEYTGTPYLWGGISGYGLDCSGYVQLLHRLVGVTIPRDADQQFDAGRPVEPPFKAGDLFFFGSQGAHRSISHVGMSLGGWLCIHSSRLRNGVHQDDVQKVDWLKDVFVGARTFLS
jgi:SH3-like domain-containing protein